VLADGETVAEIKLQQRNLIVVEMEAYGLYAAASLAGNPKPIAFALKSVCDFADPDKKNAHQAYAAYTSATALKEFFERFMAHWPS
jgi:nucleoside phosphorylase